MSIRRKLLIWTWDPANHFSILARRKFQNSIGLGHAGAAWDTLACLACLGPELPESFQFFFDLQSAPDRQNLPSLFFPPELLVLRAEVNGIPNLVNELKATLSTSDGSSGPRALTRSQTSPATLSGVSKTPTAPEGPVTATPLIAKDSPTHYGFPSIAATTKNAALVTIVEKSNTITAGYLHAIESRVAELEKQMRQASISVNVNARQERTSVSDDEGEGEGEGEGEETPEERLDTVEKELQAMTVKAQKLETELAHHDKDFDNLFPRVKKVETAVKNLETPNDSYTTSDLAEAMKGLNEALIERIAKTEQRLHDVGVTVDAGRKELGVLRAARDVAPGGSNPKKRRHSDSDSHGADEETSRGGGSNRGGRGSGKGGFFKPRR
ncbi:hypothetical protein C8F01DRAFT_1093006 [Mycena amicta]|nr:hypothetical protein C8F01DRAFT_1093006 [Mycena amicta]